MEIGEVTDRLKAILPKDVKIESRREKEPKMGWRIYVYWDLDGPRVGVVFAVTDSDLPRISEKNVSTLSKSIQRARARYEAGEE